MLAIFAIFRPATRIERSVRNVARGFMIALAREAVSSLFFLCWCCTKPFTPVYLRLAVFVVVHPYVSSSNKSAKRVYSYLESLHRNRADFLCSIVQRCSWIRFECNTNANRVLHLRICRWKKDGRVSVTRREFLSPYSRVRASSKNPEDENPNGWSRKKLRSRIRSSCTTFVFHVRHAPDRSMGRF